VRRQRNIFIAIIRKSNSESKVHSVFPDTVFRP